MSDIQKVPYEGLRIETGALKIGDDWPGLFLRGDSCIDLAGRTQWALEFLDAFAPAEVKQQIHYALAIAGLEGVRDMIVNQVLLPPPPAP